MSQRRVAIITGGARGIGRALGERLAADGWKLALCYRTSQKEAEDAVRAIDAAGSEGYAERCDVSDPEACARLTGGVLERWGRLDALVNAAGPYERAPILEASHEHWHAMFDNNLHPVFYMSRLAAEPMKARGWGRIINFSMANADRLLAQPHLTGHYIAKVGVLVLTRTLAKVLAPHGITVNAISPGFLDTGSAPAWELERMRKRIPAGYVGTPDDAASIARFLLSDDARYVNGANIQVSGAWGV